MRMVCMLQLASFLFSVSAAPRLLYVSPSGSDANDGSSVAQSLASCRGAVSKIQALYEGEGEGVQPGGVEVLFAPGIYVYNDSTACGSVGFQATESAPIVFRGPPSGNATFDGSVLLDATQLQPVTNATVLGIINPAAKNKVLVMPAKNKPHQLLWNGVPLTESQWPNGAELAYVQTVFDKGAVYADGRTPGPRPHYNYSDPIGGKFSLAEQPTGDWAKEQNAGPGFGRFSLYGYFANDWYSESHLVARVNQSGTETTLKLLEFSRYGILEAVDKPATAPGRFQASGLLCELDSPGEWWYDTAAHLLYVYPIAPALNKKRDADATDANANATLTQSRQYLQSVRLGSPDAGTFLSLANATWITLRDVALTGSTSALVTITGGANNTLGGCTLSSSHGGVR
jgi:hypothetical protein